MTNRLQLAVPHRVSYGVLVAAFAFSGALFAQNVAFQAQSFPYLAQQSSYWCGSWWQWTPCVNTNGTTATPTIARTVDIAVSKTGPASATFGEAVTYVLTANNKGTTTAQSVSVSESMNASMKAAGFIFSPTLSSPGCVKASNSDMITCKIGSIEPGAAARAGVVYTTKVPQGICKSMGIYTGAVSGGVAPPQLDSNASNNFGNSVGTTMNCPISTASSSSSVPGRQTCVSNMQCSAGSKCESGVCTVQCGNGRLDVGESCDDGNTVTGDGCSNICVIDFCGNGTVEPKGADGISGTNDDEQCDNGNVCKPSGSSCISDYDCASTGGIQNHCVYNVEKNPLCTTGCKKAESLCGNGNVDVGEECDQGGMCRDAKGNFVSMWRTSADAEACRKNGLLTVGMDLDGCSAACKHEYCGDGIFQELTEQCDEGSKNGLPDSSCSGECRRVVPEPVCGNGKQEGTEECDDGNDVPTDACNNFCRFSPNFQVTTAVESGFRDDENPVFYITVTSKEAKRTFSGIEFSATIESTANISFIVSTRRGCTVNTVETPEGTVDKRTVTCSKILLDPGQSTTFGLVVGPLDQNVCDKAIRMENIQVQVKGWEAVAKAPSTNTSLFCTPR